MATPAPGRVYEFGPFRLEPANRVLLRGEDVVALPPKVVETLLVLVAYRDQTGGEGRIDQSGLAGYLRRGEQPRL